MRQLKSRSEDVASAVLSNAATRVVFRVGEQDAKTLAEGFSFFDAKDLQRLDVGEAIARLERADFDFNLRTKQLDAVDAGLALSHRQAAIELSRSKYAARREEVDAVLRALGQETEGTSERRRPREPGAATEADLPGRGGAEHRYVQDLRIPTKLTSDSERS